MEERLVADADGDTQRSTADVTGDERLELLVTTTDGSLYVLSE